MQGPCDGLRDYRGGDGLRANSMLIMAQSSWPPLPSFRPSLWPVRPMGESPTYCRSQRSQSAGELRSDSEPDLLNDAIFGAIYYRF